MRENFKQVVYWVIAHVMWAERELRGKSGKEKRAALIDLAGKARIKFLPSWLTRIIVGAVIDVVVAAFNEIKGHGWGEVEPVKKEAQ